LEWLDARKCFPVGAMLLVSLRGCHSVNELGCRCLEAGSRISMPGPGCMETYGDMETWKPLHQQPSCAIRCLLLPDFFFSRCSLVCFLISLLSHLPEPHTHLPERHTHSTTSSGLFKSYLTKSLECPGYQIGLLALETRKSRQVSRFGLQL